MDKDVLDYFRINGRKVMYGKGQVIIQSHDQPSGVFLIDKGFVKTYSITKYGETNLHLIRKRGEVFPIIWALSDIHREVFYESMSQTTLYKTSKRKLRDFAFSDQGVHSLLVGQAVELYRVHADRVNNLQLRTSKERVAYRLLALAKRFGKKQSQGVLIEAPLRHQDIADSINTARETTSRELEKLEKNKIITYKNHDIVLLKPKKLQSTLE